MSEETPEYVPKNRCKTENCTNRRVIDGSCLTCYYVINKPIPKKRKGSTKDEHDVSGS